MRIFHTFLLMIALVLPACGPTYPKETLVPSIQKLFKKEVGSDQVKAQMAGKTLYVAFPVENMVTTSLDLPKEVTEKLENAMLSISRIALSTDEKIDFTVLETRDDAWGVQTTFIRRVEDLKFMYYWKISKSDFDERFILETRKFNPGEDDPSSEWRDLSLPEYMARWVAFRINFVAKSNLFLGVLLGVEKVTPALDPAQKSLTLTVQGSEMFEANPSTLSVSAQLLKTSAFELLNKVEVKYLSRLDRKDAWIRSLVVRNAKGDVIFKAARQEWLKEAQKKEKLSRAVDE